MTRLKALLASGAVLTAGGAVGALAVPGAAGAATTGTWSCSASALQASLLSAPALAPITASTSPCDNSASGIQPSQISSLTGGLLDAGIAAANTSTGTDSSGNQTYQATSTVAQLSAPASATSLPGLPIGLPTSLPVDLISIPDTVSSTVSATCVNGSPQFNPSSTVLPSSITVAGQSIPTTQGTTTLNALGSLPGGVVTITPNAETKTATSDTVDALDVKVALGGTTVLDVDLAQSSLSLSDATCDSPAPGGGGTGTNPGGGSTGTNPGGGSTGTNPGGGSTGTNPGGGSTGTKPGSGSTGTNPGGGSSGTGGGTSGGGTGGGQTGSTSAPGGGTGGSTTTVLQVTTGSSGVVGSAPTSTPAGVKVVDYSWDWGDGTHTDSGTNPRATHRYKKFGTYKVTVTVRYSNGTTKKFTKTVAWYGPDYFLPFRVGRFKAKGFDGTLDIRYHTSPWVNRTHQIQGWVKDWVPGKKVYNRRTYVLTAYVNGKKVGTGKVTAPNNRSTLYTIKLAKSVIVTRNTRVTVIGTYSPAKLKKTTTTKVM
ncbi:MAG: PKD domain-containing protein [Solirubrobacterales bacterium]|nr:PKD domain-containing protein [Solirubrobacterales bacterium]